MGSGRAKPPGRTGHKGSLMNQRRLSNVVSGALPGQSRGAAGASSSKGKWSGAEGQERGERKGGKHLVIETLPGICPAAPPAPTQNSDAPQSKRTVSITSDPVRTGLARAKVEQTRSGRSVGRPRVVFRRDQVFELRAKGLSWREIARRTGVSTGSVRRAFQKPTDSLPPCQNPFTEDL